MQHLNSTQTARLSMAVLQGHLDLNFAHLLNVTYMLPKLSMYVLSSIGQCVLQWMDWLRSQFFLILHSKHIEVRLGKTTA